MGYKLHSYPPRVILAALICITIFYATSRTRHAETSFGALESYVPRSLIPFGESSAQASYGSRHRLQVIKAGGVPKEGLGSSLGFMNAVVNIAVLLDADFIQTQTATMMDYRASDIVNAGVTVRGGGRVCDVMEVLLPDPSVGHFQERMDRAQRLLDDLYVRAERMCHAGIGNASEPLLGDYARAELARCDTLIVNDYRAVSFMYSPCSVRWWHGVIDQYSGPAHGNDIAIHFRWGDMYKKAQVEAKWATNMTLAAHVVDIIRSVNPGVAVKVYMKKSVENESESRLREILAPLSGDFTIVQAGSDVEELAMMAKARYLILNGGSYSLAAALSGNAQLVVHNGANVAHKFEAMGLERVFDITAYDEGALREAARP
ncbi:hypothetical protein Q5752_000173 [Cryptotrichosporon argae]